MIYYRGTLSEFNTWHEAVKIAEGMPRVGYINGQPAPQNQQTVAYSESIQHPDGGDDYIWSDGKYPIEGKTPLSKEEAKAFGWFPEVL